MIFVIFQSVVSFSPLILHIMNCELWWISIFYFCSDLHSLGQLSLKKSWNPDREHRGGLQKWPEAHAAAGGDLRRDPAQAWQRQDEVSVQPEIGNFHLHFLSPLSTWMKSQWCILDPGKLFVQLFRFHKIANVNKALDFIASKGVKLVSIGAEGKNKEENQTKKLL